MEEVNLFLEKKYDFILIKKSKNEGHLFKRNDYYLSVESGWTGRWEEFLCYKLLNKNKEVFSLDFQVDTELHQCKPKLYSATEIKQDLAIVLDKEFSKMR